jgi:hypothetical protein
MTDNQLFKILRDALLTLNVDVRQSYQPSKQGLVKDNAIYVTKVNDTPRGYVKRDDVWIDNEMQHIETQEYEAVFQIAPLAKLSDLSETSMDLARKAHSVVQSSSFLNVLTLNGLGVLRVTDIRNTPFVNDSGLNEYNPTFDLTLTHRTVTISTSDVVETVECVTNRI